MLVLGLASLFSNTNSGADDLTLSADCPPPCSFFIVGASSIIFLLGVSSLRPVLRSVTLFVPQVPAALLSAALFASQIAAALLRCAVLCCVHPAVCPSTRLLRFCVRCSHHARFWVDCRVDDGRGCRLCALASRMAAYRLMLLLRCVVFILPCALQLCVFDTVCAVCSMHVFGWVVLTVVAVVGTVLWPGCSNGCVVQNSALMLPVPSTPAAFQCCCCS